MALEKALQRPALDLPGLRGRRNLGPKVEHPGLDHASDRIEDLRVVAPQLLPHSVRQAHAVPLEFLVDPRPRPEFDDDRIDGVDSPEVVKVCPQRVGEDAGIEAVVLGSGGREAVAEPVELLRVDRVDREPVVHEALDDRPVRNLDCHRYVLRGGSSASGGDPIRHLGEPRASVAEGAFLLLRAVAADHADVVRLRCPVHVGEPGFRSHHAPSPVKVSLAAGAVPRCSPIPVLALDGANSPLGIHRGFQIGVQVLGRCSVARVSCGYSRPGRPLLLLGSFDLTRSLSGGYRTLADRRMRGSVSPPEPPKTPLRAPTGTTSTRHRRGQAPRHLPPSTPRGPVAHRSRGPFRSTEAARPNRHFCNSKARWPSPD